MKLIKAILIFIFAAFLGTAFVIGGTVFFFKEFLIKKTVEAVIASTAGFRTEIGHLQYQWPAEFTLQNIVMMNPPGYEAKIFARSPYFYIRIDPEAFLQGRSFHIYEWKGLISELHIEKSREGVSNGTLLKSLKNIGRRPDADSKNGSGRSFQLDRLEVKISKVNFHDRTGVVPKYAKNMRLKASVYENVQDFSGLVETIKAEIIKEAGASRVVKLSPFYFERSIQKAAETTVVIPTKMIRERITEGAELIGGKAGAVVKRTDENTR